MRVLFATSEIAPLIKTGGLADVSAALPAALHEMAVDIRILLPGYPQVLKALPQLRVAAEISLQPNFPVARLLTGSLSNGVPLLVIECAELYERGGGIYQDEHGLDWPDNALRFGLLSKITALLGCANSPLDWKPDIVHCNDWQTGLTPAYLHFSDGAVPCVMTVHNLAFQGVFPPQVAAELGLPDECFQPDGVEFYGNLSFMKAGLYYANHITTVSPSYANEIQTDALGFGLQGLLTYRHENLTGILNGIDLTEWDPATDPNLAHPYNLTDISGKSANKRELQKRMGLHVDPDLPLFGLVSRFTPQKGVDLVLEIAPQLISLPAQLVLLGSGDMEMQRTALELAHHYSGQISAYVGFDEALSHLIEAGADIFLMPSRFEPCGLNQMYSQRYGTPPVVHATGGLIDTVVDCNAASLKQDIASGFVFHNMDTLSLLATTGRAAIAYHDKKTWRALQHNCMIKDFSWGQSAIAYHHIYTHLMRR
ncbi:Glycogen synthase [Candidatus Nitrotoga sp. HW29]|uniref:glycogen synthase GlgA n=1 Tax=Candidatus Nitrotoga sp. HW29 TaxID=2886963 RepID=UPI001EF19EBA|nr:glycogen synthase GlgA [Candidatus Nitrotoga sp. HW29]CAH1904575.1 Glycogen synthase [Candidatus Nitrotoga sp. HW29]